MKWRIYYGDGTTFDSDDGATTEAPATNVQAIVQPDPDVGRHIINRFDWYFFDEESGEWFGVDWFGLIDWMMRTGLVKAGRTIGNREYREILQRASDDPGFERKSGWRENERR